MRRDGSAYTSQGAARRSRGALTRVRKRARVAFCFRSSLTGIFGQPISDQFEDAPQLPANAASPSAAARARLRKDVISILSACTCIDSRDGDRLHRLVCLIFLIIRFFRAERRKRQHDLFQELPICIQKQVGGLVKLTCDLLTEALDLALQTLIGSNSRSTSSMTILPLPSERCRLSTCLLDTFVCGLQQAFEGFVPSPQQI
jgi:hypothetical protein